MLTKVEIIIQHIEEMIENGLLSYEDKIPSLTQIMKKYKVSRDTVIRAYKDLNSRGIITGVHGKGYFVTNRNTGIKKNIFLLLDELSAYKNTLIKSIERHMKNMGEYRVFFHHYNPEVFKKLIEQYAGHFTHYIISPFPNSLEIQKSLEQLPKNKLILLDRHDGHDSKWRFVGQEFLKDITYGLTQLQDRIHKYKRFIFIFPEPSYHPKELKIGFERFCQDQGIEFYITSKSSIKPMMRHDAYLVIDDNDLADIIQISRIQKWTLGQDIGIVSYNETHLKSVVAEGITTISTDFDKMGENLVNLLLDTKISSIHNTAHLILRNSF